MGNARCDVHRIDEAEAFLDSALGQAFVNLRGDVQESPAGRDLKPELFTVGFHHRES